MLFLWLTLLLEPTGGSWPDCFSIFGGACFGTRINVTTNPCFTGKIKNIMSVERVFTHQSQLMKTTIFCRLVLAKWTQAIRYSLQFILLTWSMWIYLNTIQVANEYTDTICSLLKWEMGLRAIWSEMFWFCQKGLNVKWKFWIKIKATLGLDSGWLQKTENRSVLVCIAL